jgi:hypothetical protein
MLLDIIWVGTAFSFTIFLLIWASTIIQMYPNNPTILNMLTTSCNSYITLPFFSVWQTLPFLQTLLSFINADIYFGFTSIRTSIVIQTHPTKVSNSARYDLSYQTYNFGKFWQVLCCIVISLILAHFAVSANSTVLYLPLPDNV